MTTEKPKIHIWNTKYALSTGISEHDVEPPSPDLPSLVVIREGGKMGVCLHGEGSQWHRTKDSAIAKANNMKKRKIASLKKQIEKLEIKAFE